MEKEIRSPNSSPSSSSSSNNGVSSSPAPAPMVTPKSTPRSADAANPYPTTFIQADAGSFKQVVQMLTGSSDTAAKQPPLPRPAKNGISSAVKATGPKKPAFKLYERRGSLKNLKMMSPMIPSCWSRDSPLGGSAGSSPRRQPTEILSPSLLDLPSLTLSPISPLNTDSFHRSLPPNSPSALAMSAEERAIAEKGFYLHPSPRTTPRDAEPPMLLQLFPVTSPRVPSASVAGSSSWR